MQLSGNTILITSGSDIGLALAEKFAELNNAIVVAARSAQKLKRAAQKGFKTETADLSDSASIASLAKRVIEKFPALNVVIHNAGISRTKNFLEAADSKIAEEIVATNLLGLMRLTNALLPHFLRQKSAAILTVSSGLAFLSNAQAATYSATKAALYSYTQSLRYQLKNTAVEVVELEPPYVQMHLTSERQAADSSAVSN